MKRILLICTIFSTAACYAQSNCINVPVSMTSDPQEITINNAGRTTMAKTYIYCHMRHRHHQSWGTNFADLNDPRASKPMLLNTAKSWTAVPQTYSVSLSTPTGQVTACPDSTMNVQANINMERQGEYTGNYPTTIADNYKLVSRRTYRKTCRKMRNVERKEARVARLTGVHEQQAM